MGELAQNWVQAETVITLPKLEHIVTGRGILQNLNSLTSNNQREVLKFYCGGIARNAYNAKRFFKSILTAKPNFRCILSAAIIFIKIRLISGLAKLFAADFRRRVAYNCGGYGEFSAA